MSRINKFVLTVSLLIFIMISAVACGIYTQMVKERVYGLKQSVIDTAFALQIVDSSKIILNQLDALIKIVKEIASKIRGDFYFTNSSKSLSKVLSKSLDFPG